MLVATDEDIPDDTIYEPSIELRRNVIDSTADCARRLPDNKARHCYKNHILFIASEEPIKEEWVQQGYKLLKEAGV